MEEAVPEEAEVPLEELKELRKSKVEFDNSYSAVDRVFELELDKISAGSMVRIVCGQENFTVRYEDKVLSFTITEAAGRTAQGVTPLSNRLCVSRRF